MDNQQGDGARPAEVVVSLVEIRDKEILLVAEKDGITILPGGKPQPGESDLACLRREISEELPGFRLSHEQAFDLRRGLKPRSGRPFLCRIYTGILVGTIAHKLGGPLPTGAEVAMAGWFTADEALSLNLSAVTRELIEALAFAGRL